MKNKTATLLMAIMVLMMTACTESQSGPTVVPPSWKGFNYVVKKTIEDKTEQTERGPINPGDEIKVYAVRKNYGTYIGQVNGTIYIRYTAYMANGISQTGELNKAVVSAVNSTVDGWEDPYATFALPKLDGECEYYRVEAACQFYFKTFGNQTSEVDYSDDESHVEPYLGNIYTDLANFDPMNGGSANSGTGTDGPQYHTLYKSK